MTDKTGIAWTESTWNPWYGCTMVSAGCDNCYMFREMRRYGRDPEVVTRSKTKFTDPLKWKEPRLIFTCSWGDWFHKDADKWRDEAWDIVRRTPHHTYQILTKRTGRIHRHLPADWGDGWKHVWLGTSIEGGDVVHRLPVLLDVPAHRRFVSAEPLIAPLSIAGLPRTGHGLHWLIAGGESGDGKQIIRPMELDWARTLRDECAEFNVAFFLKQLGGHPDPRAHEKAVLDGRTHTEMPTR